MWDADLNAGQREAASASGDVLVLSPAGSGKTKTMQRAVQRILAEGWAPESILAVTFTTKAAGELEERIASAVGERVARRMHVSTFHAFCARVIRDWPDAIGRSHTFTIFDEADRDDLARVVAAEMRVAAGRDGADAIRRKMERRGPRDLATFDQLFAESMVRYNALDYDGLQSGLLQVLERSDGARADLGRLRHILVDEYQDTNHEQATIVAQLLELTEAAGARANILRVGDVGQSIYGFRGADIRNILALASDPNVHVVKLPLNYRSGRCIVALGNAIAPHAGSPLTDVGAARDIEGEVEVRHHDTVEEMAGFIAGRIRDRVEWGARPGEHMILGRTWADLAPCHAALAEIGVPAKLARPQEDSWTTTEMRHMVAVLRCLHNAQDLVALRRVCTWPSQAVTPGELTRAEADADLRAPLDALAAAGATRLAAVVHARGRTTPVQVAEAYLAAPASDVRNFLRDAGLVTALSHLDDAVTDLRTWEERQAERGEPADLRRFLSWYAFRTVLEAQRAEKVEANVAGEVQLMTVHAAKGLQAKYVDVVGLERGYWPGRDALDDQTAAAEETRVFYVAATRAEDFVAFHTCRRRRAAFGPSDVGCSPSPLLDLVTPMEAA